MNNALKKSIVLHVIVFLLFVIDLPMFWWHRTPPGQVPIIVDLKDVKISEMTNLPPKAKYGKEDKAASTVKRKVEKKYTQEEKKVPEPQPKKPAPKAETKKAEPVPEPETPKKDFLVAPQPKKPKPKAEVKEKPKPQPKKAELKNPEPKKGKSEPELANPLKSLLASVDALEKEVGNKSAEATIKEGTKVNNMGVEGGTIGSYFSELTISEMDALAGRLRACWNLDPGAMGIEDMIVEIKATLNQNGTVRSVEIVDNGRYNRDSHFRSVADSAKRAVYICQPYKILADKYAEKYDEWRDLRLRFNPMDASIQ